MQLLMKLRELLENETPIEEVIDYVDCAIGEIAAEMYNAGAREYGVEK